MGVRARAVAAVTAVLLGGGVLTGCFPAPAPDFQVSVVDSPDPVAPGGTVTYTMTVTNTGGSTSFTGGALLQFTTTLVSGASFTAPSGYSCLGLDISTVQCTRLVAAGPDTIPTGGTRVFVFSGAPFTGVTTASVTAIADEDNVVAESNEANNQETETTTISGPDLVVAIPDAPDPAPPGGTITWTVTVRNAGATLSVNPGAILLTFSVGGNVGTVTVGTLPTGYSCGVNDLGEAVTVGCSRASGAGVDTIAGGTTRVFTISAPAPTQSTTIASSASVDPLNVVPEVDNSNNGASATTAVGTRDVGRVSVTPRHGQAEVGRPETLRVTWTHPESWRLLDTLEVRLTLSGTKVFRARWDQDTDAIAQLEGTAVALDAGSAAGQNTRKVRLTLVIDIDDVLAGLELVIEALATDDTGRTQDWAPVGTLRTLPRDR
jgi:uncharacterized repeat protein (TIGR01451 family)